MRRITLVYLIGVVACWAQTYTITTVAGGVNAYYLPGTGDGGQATTAALGDPCYDVAVDGTGNLYIAAGGLVRKVTPTGVISTVAGGGVSVGDGVPATQAALSPTAILADASGNLFIADTAFGIYRIRKVDTNGIITTVAGGAQCCELGDGGPATNAYLAAPFGLAFDGVGNLYIAQAGITSNVIRKVSLGGTISTVGGLSLSRPTGVAVDSSGALYVADAGSNKVFRVSNGAVTTFATIDSPWHIAFSGGNLYVSQINDALVSRVSPNGMVTPIAGNGSHGFSGDGGPATSAELDRPAGIVFGTLGTIYIADATTGIARIRKLTAPTLCTYSLSASGATVSKDTGTGSFTVTTQAGCGWSAISSEPTWLTLSPSSGNSTGPVNYSFTANSGAQRQATISVAGQTFTVTQNPGLSAPAFTVSPSTGSGSSQLFTFTFPDPSGFQDIAGAQVVINSTLTAVNSCYILFARPDIISLAADSGLTFQSTSLGAPAVLQNSQCVVLASLTSQSGSGTTVTLSLEVVFKGPFAGQKTVWANYNTNAGVAVGYTPLGTYTATPPPTQLTSSVSPASGSGQAQSFTFSYVDPNGAPDISGAQIAFNSSLSGANACYILFAANNIVSLASDNALSFTTAVLGQQTVLQNSQCTVYPGLSYQTQSGQTLNFTVFVSFNSSFTGTKNIYANVNNNAGTQSGFNAIGTWTITGPPAVSVNSVNPSNVTGPSQALTFTYADPAGSSDIVSAQVVVNPTTSLVNSCAIQFNGAAGSISLGTDNGSGSTTATLGQPTALQNSQCIVNAAASTQLKSGNYLTLTLFITMKTNGNKNIYSSVTGSSNSTALAQFGSWNVSSPTVMMPLPVTPQTGAGPSGTTQFLTFTLSNPAGANDISGSLIVLYPSLQGAGACYILWGHNSNLLSLASDNAVTFTSGTMGSPGLLNNSQCTVDPSQSFAVQTGNTVNLTVAVAFKGVYKQFAQIYSWVNVQNQLHALSGWFVEGRFTVQ